jgi:5-methylcytosine-specific restriction enzyme subunit McrC
MEMPIQNIYYLLCYAWNKLEEGNIVDVKGIETNKLYNLFAKVLINGASRLLKMGLDRGYVVQNEAVPGVKGQIDFGISLKKNLFKKARVQCEFDELSYNVLHNQILKSTIYKLALVEQLDQSLKDQLLSLHRMFAEIDDISFNKKLFRRVQLNRNNSFYDFLLKICELVIENLLPSGQKGKSKFRDFVRDERQMGILFEEFVRNFYRKEQNFYKVYREDILWDIAAGDTSFLPKMQTDISLEGKNKKIIVDTKYYRDALTEHYDKEKIKSENMYQMFAYLKNIETTSKVNRNCAGILLYPSVTKQFDISVTIKGHDISFKTINLNQEWPNIEKDLLAVIGL